MSNLLYAIAIIILGLLAVPALVLAKKPNAKELLDKVAPYTGFIGVISLVWGLWTLYRVILSTALLGEGIWGIITWVLFLAIAIEEIGLGFIMGYGLIAKYALSGSAEAKAKGDEMLAKITPYQGKLGIAAIITGIIFAILVII